LTDSERDNGSEGGAGATGTFCRATLGLGESAVPIEVGVAWRDSEGGSTCCVVELKYRARLGRRNVGGNGVDCDGIRMSNMDFLMVLLNIVWKGDYSCACNKKPFNNLKCFNSMSR
jgi:hypothetical protein